MTEQTNTPEETLTQAKAQYEQAQKNQAAAKQNLENLNTSLAEQRKQFDALKKILDGAKPSLAIAKAQLQAAEANVTIARTTLAALEPKAAVTGGGKGAGQSELCTAAAKVLADSTAPLTLDELFSGLVAAGVSMAGADPRKNLTSYVNRWSKVNGSGIVSLGGGKYGSPKTEGAAPEVPAFLAPAAEAPPAEVPAFLAPVAEPTGDELATEAMNSATTLPEDFPGRDALIEAGYVTVETLEGKTVDQLRRIKGVGAETARNILATLGTSEG